MDFLLPNSKSFELDDAIKSSRLDHRNQMTRNLNRNSTKWWVRAGVKCIFLKHENTDNAVIYTSLGIGELPD